MAKGQPPRYDLQLPVADNISFDADRFDQLTRSHAVTCEVFSAMLCPLEVNDPQDVRNHEHPGCQGGFIYTCEGEVEVSFTSNNSRANFTGMGMQDDSTVYATFPRYYDTPEGKPVLIGQYYRLFIKNCPVVITNSEKIEHHQSGIDRASYPLVAVQRIIDSRGKEYKEGKDFEVHQGNLKWYPNRSPGYNVDLNKGVVFSIHYTYKPYYYVSHMPHEIRVAKDIDPLSGEVKLERMPYQVGLQREWTFDNQSRDGDGKLTPRINPLPRSGGFGPR